MRPEQLNRNVAVPAPVPFERSISLPLGEYVVIDDDGHEEFIPYHRCHDGRLTNEAVAASDDA